MTDKENLQYILDTCSDEFIESIFHRYLIMFGDKLSLAVVDGLRKQINKVFDKKVEQLSHANYVATERATYIKTYLEGKMWKDEESAKANIQPQIENAQAIIDACGRR